MEDKGGKRLARNRGDAARNDTAQGKMPAADVPESGAAPMPPPARSVVSPQEATSKPLPRPESASSACPGVQWESQSVPLPTTL